MGSSDIGHVLMDQSEAPSIGSKNTPNANDTGGFSAFGKGDKTFKSKELKPSPITNNN